ncbi:MAG: hypothetical protein GC162_19400 [Planctomycetes bacterium]|nr:hypothetical protein [Planctomycetota bacterium]
MPVKEPAAIDRLPEPLRRFVAALTPEHKLLLTLKHQLYDGDWRPMIADLNNRLAGRPHVFRLAERIEDDLRRIQQLCCVEEQYQVELSELINPSPDADSEAGA